MTSNINDWLIGNANTVLLDNFRDAYTGDVETDLDAYMSLCLPTPGVITNATNVSPIVVTSNGHGLTTGDVVTIVNVGGNGGAKGTWSVTVASANTFSLDGSAGDGVYTGGGEFYKCVSGAAGLSLGAASSGTYLATVDGTLPLTDGTIYMLIIYCLGTYRDFYNELIRVVARKRGAE